MKTAGASIRQRVSEAHGADGRPLVIPRSGHTITSEEPAAFNAALTDLFANVGSGALDERIAHLREISTEDLRWT